MPRNGPKKDQLGRECFACIIFELKLGYRLNFTVFRIKCLTNLALLTSEYDICEKQLLPLMALHVFLGRPWVKGIKQILIVMDLAAFSYDFCVSAFIFLGKRNP